MHLRAIYDSLETGFGESLTRLPTRQRQAVERYKLAPFASDPVPHLTRGTTGGLYVLSMKPFAVRGRTYPFGWEERERTPGLHRWYDGDKAGGNFVREADDLLRRVLAATGNETPPREVFNTYATFWRAEDSEQLKAFGLTTIDCADYHQRFLERLQPRLVLCIGNGPAPSAFALMARLHGNAEPNVERAAPRVFVKHFHARAGRLVIGVPHLSYVRAATFWPVVERLLAPEQPAE